MSILANLESFSNDFDPEMRIEAQIGIKDSTKVAKTSNRCKKIINCPPYVCVQGKLPCAS